MCPDRKPPSGVAQSTTVGELFSFSPKKERRGYDWKEKVRKPGKKRGGGRRGGGGGGGGGGEGIVLVSYEGYFMDW